MARVGGREESFENIPLLLPSHHSIPLSHLTPPPPGGTGAGATYFMTFLKANVFQRSNKVSCPAARGKYKYLGAVIRLFLGIWKNSSRRGIEQQF